MSSEINAFLGSLYPTRKLAAQEVPPTVHPIVEASQKLASAVESFLCQFEGTPLYEQAIALCEEDMELEAARLQQQMEERANRQGDLWTQQDMVRLKKRQLELELSKLKSAPAAEPAAPAAATTAAPPSTPVAEPAAPPAKMAGAALWAVRDRKRKNEAAAAKNKTAASAEELMAAERTDKAKDKEVLKLVDKTKKKVVEDIEDHDRLEKSAEADEKLKRFAKKERGEDKGLLKKIQDAEEHVKDDIEDFGRLERGKTSGMMPECSPGPGNCDSGYLAQFEGSPLHAQAVALLQKELELEAARIRKSIESQQASATDDYYDQSCQVRLEKERLELELAKSKMQATAAAPDAGAPLAEAAPKTAAFLEKVAGKHPKGPGDTAGRYAGVGSALGDIFGGPSGAAAGGALGGALGGAAEGRPKERSFEGAARGAFGGAAGSALGSHVGRALGGSIRAPHMGQYIGSLLGASLGAKATTEGLHVTKTASPTTTLRRIAGAATKAKPTAAVSPLALGKHMAKANPAAAVTAGVQHGMPIVANHATLAQLEAMPFHKLQSASRG